MNISSASPLTSRSYASELSGEDVIYCVLANPDTNGFRDKQLKISQLEAYLFGSGGALTVDNGDVIHVISNDNTHSRKNLTVGVLARYVLGQRDDAATFTVDDAIVLEKAISGTASIGTRLETSIGNMKDFILGKTTIDHNGVIDAALLSLTFSTSDANVRKRMTLPEFSIYAGRNFNKFSTLQVGSLNDNLLNKLSIDANGNLTTTGTGSFTQNLQSGSFNIIGNTFIIASDGSIFSSGSGNNFTKGLNVGVPVSGKYPIVLSGTDGSVSGRKLNIWDSSNVVKFSIDQNGFTIPVGPSSILVSIDDLVNLDAISSSMIVKLNAIAYDIVSNASYTPWYDNTKSYVNGDVISFNPGTGLKYYKCVVPWVLPGDSNNPANNTTAWLRIYNVLDKSAVGDYVYTVEDAFEFSKPIKLMSGVIGGNDFLFPRLEARQITQSGIPPYAVLPQNPWMSSTSYAVESNVFYNGLHYASLIDGNINQAPDANCGYNGTWRRVFFDNPYIINLGFNKRLTARYDGGYANVHKVLESDITIELCDDLINTETHLNSEYISIGARNLGERIRFSPIEIRSISISGKILNHANRYFTTIDFTMAHMFVNKEYGNGHDGTVIEPTYHIDPDGSRLLSNMTYIVGPQNVVSDNVTDVLVDKQYMVINRDGSVVFDQIIDATGSSQNIPSWNKYITYQLNDIVQNNGGIYSYVATTAGNPEAPGNVANSIIWSTIVPVWSSTESYSNITAPTVYFNGEYYLFVKVSVGNLNGGETGPNNSTNWMIKSVSGNIDAYLATGSFTKNQLATALFTNAYGVVTSFGLYKCLINKSLSSKPPAGTSNTYWSFLGNIPVSSNYNQTVIGLNRRGTRFNNGTPTNFDSTYNISISKLYTLGKLAGSVKMLDDGTFVFDRSTNVVWDMNNPDKTYQAQIAGGPGDENAWLQNSSAKVFSVTAPYYSEVTTGVHKSNNVTYNITVLDIAKLKTLATNIDFTTGSVKFNNSVYFNNNIEIDGNFYLQGLSIIDKAIGFTWDLNNPGVTYTLHGSAAPGDPSIYIISGDTVLHRYRMPTESIYGTTKTAGYQDFDITAINQIKLYYLTKTLKFDPFGNIDVTNANITTRGVVSLKGNSNIFFGSTAYIGDPLFTIIKSHADNEYIGAPWNSAQAGGYTNANDVLFRIAFEDIGTASGTGAFHTKQAINITVGHFVYLYNKYAQEYSNCKGGGNYVAAHPTVATGFEAPTWSYTVPV